MPLLATADHAFLFERFTKEETKTRFVHHERVGGLFGLIMRGSMSGMRKGYVPFNEEFKKFIESG